MGAPDIGRLLIAVGIVVVVVGLLLVFGNPLRFGRLPGDVSGGSGGVSFAFPIVTCIVISVLLTIVINIVFRVGR